MYGTYLMKTIKCAIDYKDNYQDMILAISVGESLEGEKAVWIFPVPSKPEDTKLNIVKGFPYFTGKDIEEGARSKIAETFAMIRISQIYPLGFYFQGGFLGGSKSANDLLVHQSVREMGLATELISAEDTDSLIDYLGKKGFNLGNEYRLAIDMYIGREYSFVVSWIDDIEEFKEQQNSGDEHLWTDNILGVNISFPTDKLYYPLKPTSVYGDREVPATVYVTGYVTPEIFEDISPYTNVRYFEGHLLNERPFEEGDPFYDHQNISIQYTKIEIVSPSNKLSDDLWINTSTPARIVTANYIYKTNLFVYGLIIFLILSCISGLVAGIISFWHNKIPKYKFILLGLSNIFTILGVIIAANVLRIDKVEENTVKHIREKSQSIFKSITRDALVHLVIVFILLMTIILSVLDYSIYNLAVLLTPLIVILIIVQVIKLSREKFSENCPAEMRM